MIQLTVSDNISPELIHMLDRASNPRRVVGAVLEYVKQAGVRSFNTPSVRPAPWPNKADGTPATLKKAPHLWTTLRVLWVGSDNGAVGSSVPYAAIHQFGGKTGPSIIRPRNGRALAFFAGGRVLVRRAVRHPGSRIPARPYFPFLADGALTEKARQRVEGICVRMLISERA